MVMLACLASRGSWLTMIYSNFKLVLTLATALLSPNQLIAYWSYQLLNKTYCCANSMFYSVVANMLTMRKKTLLIILLHHPKSKACGGGTIMLHGILYFTAQGSWVELVERTMKDKTS